MIRAIIAATLAFPAAAEVTIQHHEPGAAPFATITLQNRTESGGARTLVTLGTAHGPVVLRHDITWNSAPDPRDALTVIELPSTVIAYPEVIHVDEQRSGEIKLYIWQGM